MIQFLFIILFRLAIHHTVYMTNIHIVLILFNAIRYALFKTKFHH